MVHGRSFGGPARPPSTASANRWRSIAWFMAWRTCLLSNGGWVVVTQMAKCDIKNSKQDGGVTHLILACATYVMLSSVQASFKIMDPDGHVIEFVQPRLDDSAAHRPSAGVSSHMTHVGILVSSLPASMRYRGAMVRATCASG